MDDVLDCVLDKLEDVSEKMSNFSLGEFGILKTCCITFGLLVGAFHARRVKKNALLIFIAFILSAVYLMIRICFDDEEDWDEDYDDDDFDPEEFMANASAAAMEQDLDEALDAEFGSLPQDEEPCTCEEPCPCGEEHEEIPE